MSVFVRWCVRSHIVVGVVGFAPQKISRRASLHTSCMLLTHFGAASASLYVVFYLAAVETICG